MIPEARLEHALPGRVRIRVPDMRGDAGYFDAVTTGLSGYPGIGEVRANATSGGILVTGRDLAVRRVGALAESRGWFRLSPSPEPAGAGRRDLAGPVVLLLLLMALVQAVRGQVMVPALSLLFYASRFSD